MAARTDRQAARARVMAAARKMVDRLIPADEEQPLRGRTFAEWEDQADQFDQEVTGTLLEELAALDASAQTDAEDLGRCPRCGSDRLYLQQGEPKNKSVRSTHGEVVLGQQSVRCRACGRSFSPSGA